MFVVPVTASKGRKSDKKPPEVEQPHLVLTFFSALLLVLGIGLIAATF